LLLFKQILAVICNFSSWKGHSKLGNPARDPFFRVSVPNVSVLVSVSKDFGLGLELLGSRLCMSYFFNEALQEPTP